MIVVDTGSTDNTVETARALGAVVASFEWIGDFSAARNYAISLASGDIIMCPDADMWFDPPFGRSERAAIERALSRPGIEAVFGLIVDVEGTTGVVMNEAPLIVAFKQAPDIKYINPVHEQLAHPDGSNLKSVYLNEIRIFHSGYSENILKSKAQRNIALLDDAAKIEEEDLDGAHKPLTDFYIMREHLAERHYDIAFDSFMRLHKNPKSVAALKPYIAIATTYFYLGMQLAGAIRDKVSRADIYNNLVLLMKKLYPQYAGSDSVDLIYQMNFDMRNDVFLDGFEKICLSFDPKASNVNSDAIRAYAAISSTAANICWQRGKLEKAFDYCIYRLNCSDIFDMNTFTILLSCMKGQPESEIIIFLSALFDCSIPIKAHTLAEGLQHDGYQTIFKYFMIKQIELNTASKRHFLLMLLLNGNYGEAIDKALSMDDARDTDLISDTAFLAIFCSEDDALYDKYVSCLNPALSEIMRCYQSDEMIKTISLFNPALMHYYYSQIAFIAGLPKALRFLHLFRFQPDVCFAVESKYYLENSMHVEVLLSEYFYETKPSYMNDELILAALMHIRDLSQALERIKFRLEKHGADQNILNQLLAIADSGDARTADEARSLYDYNIYLFNEYIDMNDVVNTGIVFDNVRKRDKKRLSEISAEDFNREAASDDKLTQKSEYLGALEGAAKIYEKNGLHAMAAQCYKRLYACGHAPGETAGALARVFKKLNNKNLSNYFLRLSELEGGVCAVTPENSKPALSVNTRRLH
jgi:glycosyltransferase involved in cell wall biosynthesis